MEGKPWAKPFRGFPQLQIFAKGPRAFQHTTGFLCLVGWVGLLQVVTHLLFFWPEDSCPWRLFSTGAYCSLTKADTGTDERLHMLQLKHDLHLELWPGSKLHSQNWHRITLLTPFQPLWFNCFRVPFTLVTWKAVFSLAMGDIFLAQWSHA